MEMWLSLLGDSGTFIFTYVIDERFKYFHSNHSTIEIMKNLVVVFFSDKTSEFYTNTISNAPTTNSLPTNIIHEHSITERISTPHMVVPNLMFFARATSHVFHVFILLFKRKRGLT